MSISEARRNLHALVRESRSEGAKVTLTTRGEPVATLHVDKEARPVDWEAFWKDLEETYERDPALAREAAEFHHFMQLVVAYRGVPNWMERIEDPSDPELT